MAVIVDRRLYLAADNETLVEDGDPQAAFLWATEGDGVTDEEAKRVGYKPSKKAAPKPADKQRSAPSEDKSASTGSLDDMTKGRAARRGRPPWRRRGEVLHQGRDQALEGEG